jgi:hypothetical protein
MLTPSMSEKAAGHNAGLADRDTVLVMAFFLGRSWLEDNSGQDYARWKLNIVINLPPVAQ